MQDSFKQFLFSSSIYFSSTIPALFGLGVALLLGSVIGLNFIPSGVACSSQESLCYKLRFLSQDSTFVPKTHEEE